MSVTCEFSELVANSVFVFCKKNAAKIIQAIEDIQNPDIQSA